MGNYIGRGRADLEWEATLAALTGLLADKTSTRGAEIVFNACNYGESVTREFVERQAKQVKPCKAMR